MWHLMQLQALPMENGVWIWSMEREGGGGAGERGETLLRCTSPVYTPKTALGHAFSDYTHISYSLFNTEGARSRGSAGGWTCALQLCDAGGGLQRDCAQGFCKPAEFGQFSYPVLLLASIRCMGPHPTWVWCCYLLRVSACFVGVKGCINMLLR